MKIFVFSGSHWDREWYQTYQGFRMRLVDMMDRLIEGLEQNPDYGVFHLDGQTIVLEDYLEIRPENRGRLEKLIRSGRIAVGPWYCMPDEFLLSGESLIKNLQKGFALARSFGAEPMMYGYICDIFGHIAQMPQIFARMGIAHALLGRGTNEHTTPMHFRWEAPDGSGVTVFKVTDEDGYTSFTAKVLLLDKHPERFGDDELRTRLKALVDAEIARANIPVLLLTDAADHTDYHGETPRYIRLLKELYPEAEVEHAHIREFCRAVDACGALPVRRGELAETAKIKASYIHLLTNVLSSRYPLKKENDRLQARLEKWIQPLYALGATRRPLAFLELANTWLLRNHPHDSICGCSIDAVHRDMAYRFAQANAICDQLMDEFRAGVREGDGGELTVRVYNPLPYTDERVVSIQVDFPPQYPRVWQEPFGYEPINSFRLLDAEGREVPYGLVSMDKNRLNRYLNEQTETVDTYTLAVRLRLEPMGFTELRVVPFEHSSRYLARLPQSDCSADNDRLHIEFSADGRLHLLDKETGVWYRNLLGTVDDGEIGDGWNHANPAEDSAVSHLAAGVEKIENNCCRVVFRVTQTLAVPARLEQTVHGLRRSAERRILTVTHDVALSRGDGWVEVQTTVDNTAEDHRLRLRLSAEVEGATYFASQPFCFVERKAGVDIATQTWEERALLERQTSGIVCKRNARGGLAFLSAYGLHECGVTEEGEMTITLLRAFARAEKSAGERDCQLPGRHVYHYILMPMRPDTTLAELQRRQDFLQAGILSVTARGTASAPAASALWIESDTVLYSTLTPAHGGRELRLYNCADTPAQAVVHMPALAGRTSVCLVNLDGEETAVLPVENGAFRLRLGMWEIVTVQV